MKYFTLKSVANAYKANSKATKNKFWGLLSILSSIDSSVKSGVSYDFSTSKVSDFLENLFCLEDDKKKFTGDSTWNIMLSNKWTEKVSEQMLLQTPNIYDVLIWYFRRTAFKDDITDAELIKSFLERIHITSIEAKTIFDFRKNEFDFSDTLYSEKNLYDELGLSGLCITADSSSVVAHPGELSRAPFIQTLYAGQSTLECLIITPFKFSDFYAKNGLGGPANSENSIQKIYYGCPGTGKSFTINKDHVGIDGEKAVYFDEKGNKIDTPATKEERFGKPSNVFRTTFHPDYDYSNFVGSYKPVMKKSAEVTEGNNEKRELEYDFVPQVFTKAYLRAYKSKNDDSLSLEEKQVYLIIEEINRGNCAQIFGDLFQLLDRKDGVSEYPVIPYTELINYLNENGLPGDSLRLPENFHILATMNTSDQSLFPMDSAFKRRWAMEYVPINLKQEDAVKFTFTVNGAKYSWVKFLAKINPLIRKATDSEDKQMGEFFIKGNISEEDFKNKVMFYIWNDVCKDLYSASRLAPQFFMRDNEGEGRENAFTFAELYGAGRFNEEEKSYTEPSDLLEGFITKYLKLEKIEATPAPNPEQQQAPEE